MSFYARYHGFGDDDGSDDSGSSDSSSSDSSSSDSSSAADTFTPDWNQPTENSTVNENGAAVPYYLAPNNADGSAPQFTTPALPYTSPPPTLPSAGTVPTSAQPQGSGSGGNAGSSSSFLPGLMNIFGQSNGAYPTAKVAAPTSGTPSWVIPVAIGGVALIGLVIFVVASKPSAPVAGYGRRRSRR